MSDSAHIYHQGGEGPVLKLGVPPGAEVTVKVAGRQGGGAVSAGVLTIPAGALMPRHRHLEREEVLVVYKGQGRVVLEGRSSTIVPGTVIYVPRQAWLELRNTGTGLLQLAWIVSPAGLEEFFRDLAQLGSQPDPAALGVVVQRHGVELRPAGPAAASPATPSSGHRKRHRGRRGRGRGAASAPGSQPVSAASAATPAGPAGERIQAPAPERSAPESSAGQGGRHRRHRGRRGGPGEMPNQTKRDALSWGGGGQPAVAPSAHPAAVSSPPIAAPSAGGRPAHPSPGGRPGSGPAKSQRPDHRRGGRRFGRVKEVYMGGKWIRVVGEGPVISTEPASESPEDAGA
jgi:quercetin dioxygenase-like cupin family protein